MDKTVYIENVPSIELGGQTYEPSETSLISSFDTETVFDPNVNYVEYHIFNGNKFLVDSVDKLESYKIYDNQVYIDPEQDLESRVAQPGQYYSVYNFLTPLLSSSIQETYYISEISLDRTELRLATTDILAGDVVDGAVALKQLIETTPYYQDFYLNFGDNNLIIANNVLLDDSDPENPTVLIKLYEPLPGNFQLNTQCWAVQKVAESKAYLFNVQISFAATDELISIKGPNTNLNLKTELNTSTVLSSNSDLTYTTETGLKNQLASILAETGVELNIDYSDYNNFIFFSSAETRLENFYYKLSLLEGYTYSASLYTDETDTYNSSSAGYWNNKVTELITNFDGYEYYLYYESGSTAWPKSNSTPPYVNYPTTSSQAVTWLNTQLATAQTYDNENKDQLKNTIPLFIQNDATSANYELFIEMAGQHFDDIWLYIQAVTEKYNNTNGVNQGLSKDLVAKALQDFGIKIYQNNFTITDLYSSYLGITPSGSLLPNTGQELIDTYVTASATGSLIPLKDLPAETYKRLYHNLPLLVKKKGTLAGLHLLRTIYGVPDTILRINEFGGKDQNTNTWDYWQDTFDYALDTQGTNFVTSSFAVNTAWGATDDVPSAVEFRFKTPGIPAASNYSQSLWSTDKNVALRLKYTGTANTSGSYSGSIVDPYNQYGYLEFFPDITDLNSSASIYLPFFNQDWWAVLINKNSDSSYTIYAGNTVYDGNDGNTLGFTGNSTVSKLGNWSGSIDSYFGSSSLSATIFSGSLQEIRYYKNALDQSVFNDFIMNPGSIEGNGLNSAPDQLIFRAALGGELYTQSLSIHPKVSGQWATTASFAAGSDFYFNTTPVFVPNTAVAFYDQPAVGIQNAVSDKINIQGNTVYGTTLSGLASLQQNYPASQSFTRDINYLEVGYSPQNEINEDIMDSIGYFNIGEYIGDPRQISSPDASYPELDSLRNSYFQKYNKSYDYQDYFRLIKFYDNSLFKLIKDFIPARTAAATGAIVKQHLLERNRQRPAQVSYTEPYYTASVTSAARNYQTGSIETFEGGPGGSVNQWINVSQSYTASVLGPAGLVTYIESSEKEFYNGQYSGSTIECQLSESINTTPLLNNVSSSRLSNIYEDVDYNSDALNPTNLSLIQSGSAYKAAIQDSNYSKDTVWSTTRYNGSENTGVYNTDILFPSTSIAPGYPIDYFTPYFAYFDWVGGSNPEYLGGGNTHIIKLINAETKEVITLSEQNKNLEAVSQIYKKGNPVYLIPFSASITTMPFAAEIVEGGALYYPILQKSGSTNYSGFVANYQSTFAYDTASFAVSGTFLIDSGSTVLDGKGWLYSVATSSAPFPNLDLETYQFSLYSQISIYNKVTNELVPSSTFNFTENNQYIRQVDTYLPIKPGDIIQFGTTSSIDSYYTTYTIKKINLGTPETTTTIETLSSIDPTKIEQSNKQNFRIIRRIPNETFVITNTIPYRGSGLLVPYNLDPKYSPVEIAAELGL